MCDKFPRSPFGLNFRYICLMLRYLTCNVIFMVTLINHLGHLGARIFLMLVLWATWSLIVQCKYCTSLWWTKYVVRGFSDFPTPSPPFFSLPTPVHPGDVLAPRRARSQKRVIDTSLLTLKCKVIPNCCFKFIFGMADFTSADVPMKFWLRAESKPHEQRTPLTPHTCKQLLAAGEIIALPVVCFGWLFCF